MVRVAMLVSAIILFGAESAGAGIVNTIAGTGVAGYAGDGGPAIAAELFLPNGVAVAADGTLYFADSGNLRIRRVTPGGVIDTVAGDGTYGSGGDGGPAVAAQLSEVVAIALDEPRNALYFADSGNGLVRRVNLATGLLDSVATFPFPQGIAVSAAGTVYVSSGLTCTVTQIDPVAGTIAPFAGNGGCAQGVDGVLAADTSFYLPTGLAIDAAGNLFVIEGDGGSAPSLGYRVRRIDAATGLVSTVAGGGANPPGSAAATETNLGLLRAIATDYAPLGTATLLIASETQVFSLDLSTGALSLVAGDGLPFYAGDGGPATEASFNFIGGVANAPSGAVVIGDAGNNRIRVVASDAPGGDIAIVGTGLQIITLTPTIVPGGLTIIENDLATTIDLHPVEVVGGDLTVLDNGDATVILDSVQVVGGDLAVESTGTGTFVSNACVAGSSDMRITGYAALSAKTGAAGSTSVTIVDGNSFGIALQPGTFTGCVAFSLARVAESPASGTDAEGNGTIVDPVDAYQVVFDVPDLGAPATLTFEIVLAELDAARREEFLEALASGTATLATRSDGAGSFQSFRICSAGEEPAVNGCVALQLLGADGNPTSGAPERVRFTALTGHFSTWAVAIVRAAPSFNGLLQPYPAPPHATVPSFRRGSVVPLKFNWIDAAGLAVDSAAAAPSISIRAGDCSAPPSTSVASFAPEDAGQSGGLRYDASERTWTHAWSTKPLAAGCYWIEVRSGSPGYPPPAQMFPLLLRDR